MKIRILEGIGGAGKAEGLAIVIDVFRAFSLECYVFSQGAKEIRPIGDLDRAFALKREHPDWVLMGERGGARVEGCDFGNSPWQCRDYDFAGKTVVHTTSAGTQGIVGAFRAGAEEIVTASLVNAAAVADYVRERNPETVSIIAMGKSGIRPTGEDDLCASYLEAELSGRDLPVQEMADALRDNAGLQFFNPDTQEIFPKEDFGLCTRCNRFPFVIRVLRDPDGSLVNRIAGQQAERLPRDQEES